MYQKTIKNILLIVFSLALSTWVSCDAHALGDAIKNNENIGANRAVLVTGASSGIGNQIALTLAEQGFYVYAGARKTKDIEALSKIKNMQGIRLDVTVQSEIDAAVKYIESEGRGLYGLVNNAGVFLFDPLIEVSEKDMQFIIDVNVMGPYRVTKAFAPLIIKSKGRISTIGSIAGLMSGKLFGPYGITKFAVEAYSEALSSEMKKFDVKVSVIEPGNFQSNIMKNMATRLKEIDQSHKKSLYREDIERFGSFTQADRSHHKSPKPVADAVLHFMTNDNPRFRYLVTPNKAEAEMVINKLLEKLVKINEGQSFRMNDESILKLLNSLIAKKNEQN